MLRSPGVEKISAQLPAAIVAVHAFVPSLIVTLPVGVPAVPVTE